MALPDPSGRLAALQVASQGQPASPGQNDPQAMGGPNVDPREQPNEVVAQQQGVEQTVTEVLARVNVLEHALIARGALDPSDLDPNSAPAGPAPQDPNAPNPNIDQTAGPGGPVPPGAQPPPAPQGGAPQQPMGGGPKQPY